MPATRLLTGTDTRCIKMSKKAVFSFLAFIRRVRALLSVSVELLVCGSHRALGGSGALALLRARSVSCSVYAFNTPTTPHNKSRRDGLGVSVRMYGNLIMRTYVDRVGANPSWRLASACRPQTALTTKQLSERTKSEKSDLHSHFTSLLSSKQETEKHIIIVGITSLH